MTFSLVFDKLPYEIKLPRIGFNVLVLNSVPQNISQDIENFFDLDQLSEGVQEDKKIGNFFALVKLSR
jgi:hypothetical protein